jgi:uncharacterized protein (TIGR03032 family)
MTSLLAPPMQTGERSALSAQRSPLHSERANAGPECAPEGEADFKAAPPLRSIHTTSFPQLLEELGVSLLVTTYQAGKLVVLRSDRGCLNTHFRGFQAPMGLAADAGRLAIGTPMHIWDFVNAPAVGQKLEPVGRHDACYVPRSAHVTGAIQIHEMAWAGEELWFVNTRFSCLCTRDAGHNFVPRWRPPFVSGLAPEDRCHLNGLGMVDGQPGSATALGATDSPAGWRANKKNGGILMKVPSGEILLDGLSMPHSPRWYDGRLWVLESGTGGIGTVDVRARRLERLAELPGFTRGLDFYGPYAFIGLSQVRETAIFSGIPITERPVERVCGVWVLDIRTGQTIAYLKFEDAVQEVFAVQVLPGARFPELINDNETLIGDSFVLPPESMGDIAQSP